MKEPTAIVLSLYTTGIELPIVDPRVRVDVTGPDRLVLQLCLPCPFYLCRRYSPLYFDERTNTISHDIKLFLR